MNQPKAPTEPIQFSCPKCGHNSAAEDQLQATGGTFSKLFNIQNKKFRTLSCAQCGYTELYRKDTSKGGNIVDFFVN
jgi:predicted nucleic-acid-binding Zn-ribbon protein